MTHTTPGRALLILAMLAIAYPAAAHEGHPEQPNELLHMLLHAAIDITPLLVLVVIAVWVIERLSQRSDRANRD